MSDHDAADSPHHKPSSTSDPCCRPPIAHSQSDQDPKDQKKRLDQLPVAQWFERWFASVRPEEARARIEQPRPKLSLPDDLRGRPFSSLTAEEVWASIKKWDPTRGQL